MRVSVLGVLFLLGAASLAIADEPTVTLTQGELQALIDAESAKAVAGYVAQSEYAKAKSAFAKVNAAFAPPTPPSVPATK